ncbi:MAG TPA: efflux RND transporter periplasmic adaptor subunit [Asanoa sp.]|jgi:HlyD family secretion protein|nr:efflux RND transporter periplasmic adaptor subunit [Asanoa sp.]
MGVGRWVWVAGGAVVLLAGGGVAAVTLAQGPAAIASTSDTATVGHGAVSLAVATTGAVTPAQSYALGFATAGTVTALAVHPGDPVTKGQVLARIDDTDAKQKVDTAQAAADRAADALDAAKKPATDDCATRGRTVESALRSAAPTSSPSASPTPTRTATPHTTPTVTRPARPTTAPPSARGGGCTASGDDPVLRAQRQVSSANLALDQARDALAGTTIKAPVAGTVLSVAGAVGAEVSSGGTFVTLADPAGMQVRASVPEADAGRLAVGQAATVTLPDRPGTPLDATVVQVDPVGTSDGTLVVFGARLAFAKAPTDLLVGQTAAVRVTIATRPDALRVPSAAVRADGSVLVRTPSGDRATQVEVGLRGDSYTEITAGLIDGQEIVTASS